MLDIDHFKDYNDTFGHPAGDKALQAVAQCMEEERRGTDVVTRIGGEEFALILPETNLEGARRVAEKISAAIHNSGALERPITVSMGISLADEAEVTTGTLVQQADLALYQAKRTGRNRICVFPEIAKPVRPIGLTGRLNVLS